MKTQYKKYLTDSFYSQKEMSAIRHQIEVENSRAKRGLKPNYPEGLYEVIVMEIEN